MTNADLAIIQSDAAEREQVRIIQALVTAEMEDPDSAATDTFEEMQETHHG